MSTAEEKEKVVNDIYYNEAGYGSIKTTYSDARLKSSNMTLKYVGEWFRTNVGVKSQPGGTNSFIAPQSLLRVSSRPFPNQGFGKTEVHMGLRMCGCILEIRSGGTYDR